MQDVWRLQGVLENSYQTNNKLIGGKENSDFVLVWAHRLVKDRLLVKSEALIKTSPSNLQLLLLFQVIWFIGNLNRSQAASPSIAVRVLDPQTAELSWTNRPGGFALEETVEIAFLEPVDAICNK